MTTMEMTLEERKADQLDHLRRVFRAGIAIFAHVNREWSVEVIKGMIESEAPLCQWPGADVEKIFVEMEREGLIRRLYEKNCYFIADVDERGR